MRDFGPVFSVVEPYLEKARLGGSDNVYACCPLPDHNDRDPSFAINVRNGLWMCHGCHRSGNLATLLRLIGLRRQTIDRLTAPVRLELQNYERKRQRRKRVDAHKDPRLSEVILPESITGIFDWTPLDLVRAGFDRKLLHELDIGYDRRNERIMFPIRDTYGNLVGYSGRATVRGDAPRYKVYTGGYRDYKGEFVPGDYGPEFDEAHPKYSILGNHHLWNGYRVYAEAQHRKRRQPLIIVEGFKGCIWMIQNSCTNTVALMGSHMTKEQHRVLHVIPSSCVILLLDNDPAGVSATEKIGKWLSKSREVYVGQYPSWAEELEDLNRTGLRNIIESKVRYVQWTRTEYEKLFELDVS